MLLWESISARTIGSRSPAKRITPTKKSPNKKKRILNKDWKEFDSELLSGWKYKEDPAGRGNKMYLSPCGINLNGKSHVMKFLLEIKYSQDAISAMKSTFKTDGWLTDASLPESWLFKKTTNNMTLLSPRGAQFKSKSKAISYMKSHGDSPSDIELLSKFTRAPGK